MRISSIIKRALVHAVLAKLIEIFNEGNTPEAKKIKRMLGLRQ